MSHYIRIYHNPACGTSRNTLALIRNTGIEPTIIEYLINPPSAQELQNLISQAGLTVQDAIRKNVVPYSELNIAYHPYTEQELIALMAENPLLINRPFVVTNLGVKLCRPSELVLDILDKPQLAAFAKEDGEKIIDCHGQRIQSSTQD